MKKSRRPLEEKWRLMTTFPWQEVEIEGYSKRLHFVAWILGWLWAISGILAGSLLALPLLDAFHIQGTPFASPASIAVAIGMGFAVQLLGWLLLILASTAKWLTNVFFALDLGVLLAFITIATLGGMAVLFSLIVLGTLALTGVDVLGDLEKLIPVFVISALSGVLIIPCMILGADNLDNPTEIPSVFQILLPFSASGFCISWFFTHSGSDIILASKSAGWAFALKILSTVVFPAIGKLLTLLTLMLAVAFGRKKKVTIS
jgi:hypothetical protein